MASTSGGSHGGTRNNSGRKRKFTSSNERKSKWEKSHRKLRLEETIYQSWITAKYHAGYSNFSDSEFAGHLLSLEYRRRASLDDKNSRSINTRKVEEVRHELNTSTELESALGPPTSTPAKPTSSLQQLLTESPIRDCSDFPGPASSVHNVSSKSNILNSSLFSDDDASDDSEELAADVSYQELYNCAIQHLNKDRCPNEDSDDDSEQGLNVTVEESSSDVGSSDVVGYEDADDEVGYEDADDENDDNGDENDDDGDENAGDTEETVVEEQAVEHGSPVINIMAGGLEYGPYLKLSRGEEQYKCQRELNYVKGKKFICSLDLLLQLFVGCCRTPGCQKVPKVKHHFVGTTVVVNTLCEAGHTFRFCSSHEVNGIYANNLMSAAAVVLSGNNFSKISRMAQFLGLAFPSKSAFFRIQGLYIFPVVEEWWTWMRSELIEEFAGKDVVVGGDGQCDSPGFSAKNLCYFLMEITTSYILEVEVRDKRHVGLSSTNMEKEALKNALTRLTAVLRVVEVATDASSSIKKLISTEFQNIFHSLDVWHKSKSIRKCLTKIGQARGMAKIKAWSDHIIRHFWYCSSACKVSATTSDEEALKIMKDKWIGLLHHVCNKHEWLNGKCEHEEGSHDTNLHWFDRREKDFAELQKIVLNAQLLDSFKFYVRFRHTGSIECANSLSLVYASKRIPFSYRAYRVRKYLAAIDWNYHLGLPPAKKKTGEQIFSRKYNHRTKQWDLKIIKADKGYEYIPIIMAKMLDSRMHDIDLVTRNVSLNTSDPRLLAPTIAANPPPPTSELIRRSRFSLPSVSSEPEECEGNNSSI